MRLRVKLPRDMGTAICAFAPVQRLAKVASSSRRCGGKEKRRIKPMSIEYDEERIQSMVDPRYSRRQGGRSSHFLRIDSTAQQQVR